MILSFNNRVIKFGGVLDYAPSIIPTPIIITDGLELYLDASDLLSYPGSGFFWSDISGNGNDGVLMNGPTFNSANGGSIVFDGINDSVESFLIPSFSLNANLGLTISLWVKCSIGDTEACLFSHHTLNVNNGVRLQIYNGPLSFTFGGVADYTTSINISDNQWRNVVATSIGNTALIYINGDLSSTIAIGTMQGIPDTYKIGVIDFVNTYYLTGNMAQVLVYNRPLSSMEITQNYNATKSRFGL